MLSDKAHFCLEDFVNKHNCRNGEKKTHMLCTNFKCNMSTGGAVFFGNDDGGGMTVNGDRSHAMLQNFLARTGWNDNDKCDFNRTLRSKLTRFDFFCLEVYKK